VDGCIICQHRAGRHSFLIIRPIIFVVDVVVVVVAVVVVVVE